MSEYMYRRVKPTVDMNDTLFDEAIIEEMVTDDTDREMVMDSLGLTEPERPEAVRTEPARGAAVELGARALAVKTIMQHHNQESKVRGAARIRGTADNQFDTFYRDKQQNPDGTYAGMLEKEAYLREHAREAIETLNATSAAYEAGFSAEEIRASRRALQRESSDYQAGASNARAREKVVRTVMKSAGLK